ncbi:PP2C family protein-serine/threonine phosphatase [Nocardia goodfellowii]|uniref:Serine phosphatase RsbU (Regulator of sigma subunit) n=1 Tax=Nocardia goodfellowii TaxID=882446 RepID=A0ABS4QHD1_9NOCA|nr:PP2C family protein-serine/threonine phosphatase [Nocardia goodfellowii]MBP2191103.1 serine phosphatase RsbU (regulator of sigma subunit) [Nocardia goodfellowii]
MTRTGDSLGHAERALRASAPHALLDVLRATLQQDFAATSVDLLLADYRLSVLQPVTELPHTATPLAIRTTTAGRAFSAQQVLLEPGPGAEGVVIHLPVTVRGDRLGILRAHLPSAPSGDRQDILAGLGTMLGHELIVAERDTDLYLQARRRERLSLAAEMQWQLLPGRGCARAEYTLGGQLEPAYTIGGDNFDWSTSAEYLTVTVSNGMGQGIGAALLTNLAISALRNARRAGLDIADQACLADQAVYAQYGGSQHVSTLLLRFEIATGRVGVVDAGSPRALRLRDGAVELISFEAQLPLGMFDGTDYREQTFQVEPGDRLVIVSDGVHTAQAPTGVEYGTTNLDLAIHASSNLPAPEAARAIITELLDYHEGTDLLDDAVVVCIDWSGPREE